MIGARSKRSKQATAFTKQQEIQNFRKKAVFYMGCEGVEWTHLAQHKDMWLVVVCMAMNIIIMKNSFFTSCATNGLSISTRKIFDSCICHIHL
jgi:hypothetical protein